MLVLQERQIDLKCRNVQCYARSVRSLTVFIHSVEEQANINDTAKYRAAELVILATCNSATVELTSHRLFKDGDVDGLLYQKATAIHSR